MSYIQFLGAAGTVTGSKHLIDISTKQQTTAEESDSSDFQLLVDCGLFQGQKEWRLKNWTELPVPARGIQAVILTHAHLDHCGWIPRLCREGFKGTIYATPATVDLCGIILPDSGYLQEEDAAFHNKQKSSKHTPALPLYTMEEAKQCLSQFRAVPFGESVQLADGVSFRFVRSAHILGAAMAEITLAATAERRTLLFTGDIGRVRDSAIAPGKVVHSGPTEGESPDVLVMESTYGNRHHPHEDVMPELAALIGAAVKRGGSVVVPAFAVERTQKFLFLLKELMEKNQIPRIPVYADSPMGIHAVQIFLKHGEEFSAETKELIARYGSPLTWPGFHFAATTEESKSINESRFPSIIVSSNGMCMGGRIQHHLIQRLPDPRNLILFIGYQAVGTRGRQIKEGAHEVKIFGEIVPVRAQVAVLEQFSDHADVDELLEWLHTFKKIPLSTHIVHGEPDSAEALRQAITSQLHWTVDTARYMQKDEIQ
ncbi:MAG: MBL fold metallo-hydrolase [Candidatus Korobacteraceae bacterium]